MEKQGAADATYHVLLIGIDNYPSHKLKGCVNDIDAVQHLLEGPRMRIPKEQIRRLASPLPDPKREREPAPGEQHATALNIRRELEALGTCKVADGDRVFIYYSGHGKRIAVESDEHGTFSREALVPVDFERVKPEFLFDFEMNRLLGAIVERTRSVTIILDCCHAGGATRTDDKAPPDSAVRALDEDHEPVPDPARWAGMSDDESARSKNSRADACQIVSACLAHEFARESDQGGVRHGVLTRAFLNAFDAVPDADLRSITWAQIWRAMRAEVMHPSGAQTPWINGYLGRAVFAGPPVHGDPGIPVVRTGDRYQIWAGTIAEVTDGVELAIYGDLPLQFPPLGSAEDRAARAGVVRVTDATLSDAVALPIEAPFCIPPGARGRVVKAAPLPCAVVPPNSDIVKALRESPLIKPVGPGEAAAVRLELHDDRWYLMDEQHGTGKDAPVLIALHSDDIFVVRDVLEHYYRYSLPLRVAERAATARPNGLELRLLSHPDDPKFDATVDISKLLDAPLGHRGTYRMQAGAGVCMHVRNRMKERLHVALFDVTGAGDVQHLDDQVIEPGAFHLFWHLGNEPYPLCLDDGVKWSRDRLIAIGRSSQYPLDYLAINQTFADVVARGHSDDRRLGHSANSVGLAELWVAAQQVIEIFEQ
jgi:hypothetical protein